MENKALLIVRYLIILIIVLGMTIVETNTLSFFPITLTLIFIVNTQLRCFLFRDKLVPIFISIFLDWILAYLSYKMYHSLLLPYFIISTIDSFFLISNFSKYILSSLGFQKTN